MRYNLATKVMRNGVEVIVATDRNARPIEPEYLRLLSSTVTRPITLAPHTLTNLMSMVLPTDNFISGQNHLMSFLQPKFITRTYYTTYDYPTTILKGNSTAVSNSKTTITNVNTEEYLKTKGSENKIQPTSAHSLTLKTSPALQTEVFHTAYTYLNTFLDGDQALVVSSTHTVSNTLIGTYDSFGDLEPSEVFPTTNTYLKTVEFTKTLTDGTDYQIISTKDVVTQVVVTDKPGKKATNVPTTTDVTKTYFVTYTYFSTYIDGDQTKVKSDVSVSSDVTIEKFYIKPKKTETKMAEKIKRTESPAVVAPTEFPFNILATRTYLTTFTYFTTLLQGPNSEKAETKINSRTKVLENAVTETIPLQNLNTDCLIQLNNSIHKITGSLVATATLKSGETILITARRNLSLFSSYQKYEIKPTKSTIGAETKTEFYLLGQEQEPQPQKIKSIFSKSTAAHVKTKTSIHKQKIKTTKTIYNEATAEALIAGEQGSKSLPIPTVTLTPASNLINHNLPRTNASSFKYSTVLSPSSTSAPQATLSPAASLNLVKQETGEFGADSESDPSKKKPTLKLPVNHQMNVSNLLNLNSLGINGINVLGPVFNAMAELIHNNLNAKPDTMSRRNDTVAPSKETEKVVKKPTSTNVNPLLNFVSKFTPAPGKGTSELKVKSTTPRIPVYIPVGSFAQDSEFGESQDSRVVIDNRPDKWHEKWKDAHAKNFEKGRPHDTPITILEGGIPISPGQVITTNSDVIIGRPGESGPRPPTFAVKNNVPIDMKPPPPPHVLLQAEEEDGFLGQHSTNQGVDFEHGKENYKKIPLPRPPPPPPKKHPHDSHKHIRTDRPHPSDRLKGLGHHKNPHFSKHTHAEYDSGTMDLNPPPVPPPPPVRLHDVHRPITINHEPDHDASNKKPTNNILPIPVHLRPNQNVENYINPVEISPAMVAFSTPLVLNQLHKENNPPIISEPTPNNDAISPNGILLISTVTHIPLNFVPTANPALVDRSTGHPLLVNIQPSQVANIVIPHGSSTALIVSGGNQHSLKGEVIDDPSPHPEPETVGFVGAEPVLKIESDVIAGAFHNDVVPAAGGVGTKQNGQGNRVLFSNRPQLTTELIKIRPKPTFGDVGSLDQHSSHLASEQHSQHVYLEYNQFGHQSPPAPLTSHPGASIYHQGTSSFVENHHHTDNNFQVGGIQNHRYEGQVNGAGGIHLSQNHNGQVLNYGNGAINEIAANQNYRKKEQNLNDNLFNNRPPTAVQNIPSKVLFLHNQLQKHNHLIGAGGLYVDQSQYIQGTNSVKGGNGIYVDISPPGHLPPRPDANQLLESHSSLKQPHNINENLSNHQSGVVHDVPLNAQVQLGSGHRNENPLKEILISANTNKHDNIFDSSEKTPDPNFSESQDHGKQPLVDFTANLSPPPLRVDGGHRPHRPAFVQPHPTSPVQKYPPHPHPSVPKPSHFMIPPPQTHQRPSHKPDAHPRPVIPIGAGAPEQNYPNPKPEDIVIVPHKNRPGVSTTNYVNDIKHEVHKQPSNIYSDVDVTGVSGSLKTEYGEEIQESISRPLFPGQLPSELQKFNSTHHNHKNVDNSNGTPNFDANSKLNGSFGKPENTKKPKPEISFANPELSIVTSGGLRNVSTHWSSNQHQSLESDTSGGSKGSSGLSAGGPFFSSGKKPSGFVTANNQEVSGNHKGSSGFANQQQSSGFVNNKGSLNLAIHKEENGSFESSKISSGNRVPNNKVNVYRAPSGFVNNDANSNIRIHAVGPNVLPSGFVKKPDENETDSNSELHTEESNQGSSVFSATSNNKLKNSFFNKGASGFVTNNNNNNKQSSSDVLPVFNVKDKTTVTNNKEGNREQVKNKAPGGSKPISTHIQQNKLPGRFGTTNNVYVPHIQSNGQRFGANNGGTPTGRPTKPPATSDPAATIKFDSNKISIGYPTLSNGQVHNSGPNKPTRFPGIDGQAHQNLGGGKHSAGFTTKKEESSKIIEGFAVRDKIPPPGTDTKKSPQKFANADNDVINFAGSVKVPPGLGSKNETGVSFGANHNYGNQTINFQEPKPGFDVDQERDATYNNAENNADNWFASTFGGNYGNADKNPKPAKPNKLGPGAPGRNLTSSVSNAAIPTGSDVRISLLPPPKVGEATSKPEEVMGLSPPPLERPRRPQRPQRPKPPYKFEIPTTPKSTPMNMENDFPPVRTPEFNRKPLKPQDIFPPRLPDNFVHHLPEFPHRNIPKPRPPPVTSLPIDIPGTTSTEPYSNIYPLDVKEDGGRDPYFAGSEINGHSKPILNNGPGLKPPPPFATSKPKPVPHSKPFSVYQEASKIRSTEKSKPEKSDENKQNVFDISDREQFEWEREKEREREREHEQERQREREQDRDGDREQEREREQEQEQDRNQEWEREREQISPTSTLKVPLKTTYRTKVSASVSPTVTQSYKEWQDADIITGSETIFDPDQFSHLVTPTIGDVPSKKDIVTTLISTGSTTIFGNLFTSGPQKPTTSKFANAKDEGVNYDKTTIAPSKTVHTTTLTVTTTMTTVVHSVGHKPFTKTIVLTKTLISTVFNKVTETKTLVKPTTATIIQTHTVATTKTALVVPTALYPSQTKYPAGGTLKPEIFMADPHSKDTMTISVSSSMNRKEEKRKPGSTRLEHPEKDSIVVVMSNKHPGNGGISNLDVVGEEENEINESRVVVGGVFDANDEKDYKEANKDVECVPGCKAKRNELCQRIEGVMKCVCRPGFARMFPDRPCRPTYTYNVKLMLEKLGAEQLTYEKSFGQSASTNMAKLASATKEGLDRMIMQSDLRDVYHGIMVNGFQGKEKKTMVDFYVQLSENTDENKLTDIFKKTLQSSNYSLGGTELFAAREADNLNAEDFNECLNPKFHDCSENSRCFNLKGTYTCSCKEGFTDLSENSLFPGRICSDMIGCEYCGYHGACYSKGEGQITCECFQWYSGERCHINLKVLLIALVTIGAILLALLLVCAVLTCLNRKNRSTRTSRTNGSSAGYLRYRGPSSQSLDRRAMIGDSSSESSIDNLPYICPPPLPTAEAMTPKKKPVLRHSKGPAPRPVPPPGMEQRDRSVTVMIPRAKYRPMPPLSPHLTMSTFSPDKHLHKTAAQIATEQKLISYLDGNSRQEDRSLANSNQSNRQTKDHQKSYDYKSPSTNGKISPTEKKKEPRVFEYEYKMSNMLFSDETNSTDKRSAKSGDDRFRRHSESTHLNSDHTSSRHLQFRKYSAGALVSAGYEVSAKVGMHHLEDDTTEDEHSGILNSHTMKSSRSQFTTLNRTGDHKTISEARSYDETTVHPPTRSFKTHYSGSSPSSRVNNDEGHTMIERDLGSTFIMPESQLFKPEADRGSDISNFDSL